jgi:DNA-binding winged helix-turn-helix (wHTH) protein
MYRFAGFVLDPQRRELHRHGEVVHLEPQVFDLLWYLVRHRDRVVSHAELLDAVWGHRYLSDAVVATRMKEARRALGDSGRAQSAIGTFRGKGYRFVAEVQVDPDTEADELVAETAVPAVPQAPRTATEAGLTGRDDEAQLVAAALLDHRVVTITGVAGAGKSALARAVSVMVRGRFVHGVDMVDLSAVEGGVALGPLVVSALGITPDDESTEPPLRTAARLDALIVLDGVDAHGPAVASLVRELLTARDSRTRVLSTGRERLGLSNEFVVQLRPL